MTETKHHYEWISVLKFSPTQIPIGLHEAMAKKLKLQNKTPAKKTKYLINHPVPYVLYNNKYYPTDRHHLIHAAYLAAIPEVYSYNTAPTENFDKLTNDEFWALMLERGWFYNKDENGTLIKYTDLPSDTRYHKDDVYRSLAKEIRDKGYYKKAYRNGSPLPYAEFQWANYFRQHIKTDIKLNYDDVVQEAIILAKNNMAANLPGFIING
jgi:hypothetical protein